MEIRELQLRDIAQLCEMEKNIFSLPWSEKNFEDLLKHDYCRYLVAVEDERILGCAGMVVLGDEGDIDKVMVEASERGKGLAQALLRELFYVGEQLGVQAYTLEVRIHNAPAIHVYEKMGFRNEGIRPNFYEKPVEDAVIMWKRNE